MIPDNDALLTVRAIVERERERSGLLRATIGERPIRLAIRAGRLHAVRVGTADLVRWGDYLDWRNDLPRAPIRVEPTRQEQIDRDVAATIHAQQERKRLRG